MSRRHKPRAFWRLARIWFRHVRITVWLLILLGLLSVLYLHKVGLPGFAQRAVIRAFATRGVNLSFSQLHLVWLQGMVAEEVSLQTAGPGWDPRIECRQVDLNFDLWAALRLKMVPQSLIVTDGRLILPYPQTNGLAGRLTATNLQASIRFEPGTGVVLEALKGELAGCHVSASGTLANPQLLQDWRILQPRTDKRPSPAYEIWQKVSQVRDEIQFLSAPEIRLGFDVDGATPQQLDLQLSLKVDAAVSPWGLLDNPEVSARLGPLEDGVCSEIEVAVQADRVESPLGLGDHLVVVGTFSCLAEGGSLLAGRTTLSASQIATPWAGAVDLEAALGWSNDGTNWIPVVADLDLSATEVSTSVGRAQGVRADLQVSPFLGDHRIIPELPRHLFAGLEPFNLQGSVTAARVETPRLSVTNLTLAAAWSAPELSLTKLAVDCAGGHLDATADFNAISGRLRFTAAPHVDPRRFYPVLPREAIDWLDYFTWKQAPVAQGEGAFTLPEWRPFQLLWPGDLTPSLYLNGSFEVGAGSYRRIPLSGASSRFTYSNMCWYLPDLTIRSGDGSLRLEHHNNDRTGEFIWKVDGAMDPTPALILLPEDAVETRQILETLHFGDPPEVHVEFTGCHDDPSTAKAWGTLHLANTAFRGEAFEEVKARVGFTNLTLTVHELQVRTAQGGATADSLAFNFDENLAFLANGISTLPPMTVARVIGPDVIRAIESYRFLNPPASRVEGVIPLKGVTGADLRFELQGGPFEWFNFHLGEVDARVRWREETVEVDMRRAEFYDGTALGAAFFDFTGKHDADFRFNLLVEDADVQPLVAGVFQSTNRLEGRLTGSLSITNANTGDFGSWFGYGHAKLKDGFLWSVPIFGVVSPVLDVFVPGLGNSRATEAEGRYVITNSVIRTDDLVIHTTNMRLLYTGTVDFQGRVDASAEAEILRDAFVVGGIVSLALTPLSKAMIIEITGTLGDPKARPLYLLPRVLLAPLNPVKFFKGVFAPPAPEFQALPPTGTGGEQPQPDESPAR